MRSFFFILTLLLYHSACGQNRSADDSLSKFSYFIYGNKSRSTIEQGTGFFMRANKRLFFVTSAHFIVSWDFKNNKPTYPVIDTFYLRLYKKRSNKTAFLPIPTNKYRTQIKKGYAYQHPDLCIIEMGSLKEYEVNWIEFDVKDYPVRQRVSEVYLWGYPVNDFVNDRYTYLRLPASRSEGKLIADYKKHILWPPYNRTDSFNYQINVTHGEVKIGQSGSPVFFKLSQSNRIIFGGMAILGDSDTRIVFAIRPEFIIREISKRDRS